VLWLLICQKRAFEGRSRSFSCSREGSRIMEIFQRQIAMAQDILYYTLVFILELVRIFPLIE
jgi:hypothetical protein